MIEIHWLWIPLIVTLFLIILALIFERDYDGFFSILAAIVGFTSIVIYIIAGIWWLLTHIKILT